MSVFMQSRVIVNLGKLEDLYYKVSSAKTIFARNIKNLKGQIGFSSGSNLFFPGKWRVRVCFDFGNNHRILIGLFHSGDIPRIRLYGRCHTGGVDSVFGNCVKCRASLT